MDSVSLRIFTPRVPSSRYRHFEIDASGILTPWPSATDSGRACGQLESLTCSVSDSNVSSRTLESRGLKSGSENGPVFRKETVSTHCGC